MNKLKKFDAADYLDNPARRAAYLAAALETGDATFARDALGIVARAHGMNKVAHDAGLNRESLYKALGKAGNPGFGTVMGLLAALGLAMTVRPATVKRSRAGKHHVTAKAKARAAERVGV
jgi:probable addiction module antidote protein